jgi:high-affinity Fe2+/Pb2+ permease
MHGERVSAIKGRHRFYLQLAGFALLVVALVVLYYAYSWYEEVSEVRAHEQWLREFYEANAPEKVL